MRRLLMILAPGLLLTAIHPASVLAQGAPPATPAGRVSLMETLSHWKYPDSRMLDGASMSDGGNPLVQSVKCQAVLTTPDPIDKVIEFYTKKLETASERREEVGREEVKNRDAKSVTIQDDSQGRPVALRVVVVNKADTATTLVISRAAGENETHIAWLHYIRFERRR
jgi:hypothetical protein